jgi:membrane protein
MINYKRIVDFFTTEIWEDKWSNHPKYIQFLIRVIRLVALTIKNFTTDNCMDKAQSLTFYTLLSIVPLLAMFFGIAKGFGMDKLLKTELKVALAGHAEVYNWLMNFVDGTLKDTGGGAIAGVGVVFLGWSVIKLIGNTERAFNNIWNVSKPRSWGRKFTDYFSLVLIAPILMVLSSSLTVFISTQLERVFETVQILSFMKPIAMFGIKLIPYVIVWLMFSLFYIIIPNTKVNIKSALIAGVVAGSSFQIIQWGYIFFQVGVSKYNAIYGSFAALPLFFIWLSISMQVLLSGAELSYSITNLNKYINQFNSVKLNNKFRKLVLFNVLYTIIHSFDKDETLKNREELHIELADIPNKYIDRSLNLLIDSGILCLTDNENYVPAIDINKISFDLVLDKVDNYGENDMEFSTNNQIVKLGTIFDSFNNNLRSDSKNVLVKDLKFN